LALFKTKVDISPISKTEALAKIPQKWLKTAIFRGFRNFPPKTQKSGKT